MRVVSMVPSWTETLISWGIDVVGRTRYCIHPKELVEAIPIIGGTKDTRWESLEKLKPDLIIVDKEENRKSVLEKSKVPLFISHVESIEDMVPTYQKFYDSFKALGVSVDILQNIEADIKRWKAVLTKEIHTDLSCGVVEWINKLNFYPQKIYYVIWKEPWMVVSKNTFIGSVLSLVGYEAMLLSFDKKYAEIDLLNCLDKKALFLFSSEPYAFNNSKEKDLIRSFDVPSAIVDGESFSWFGERSLKFLESL